MLRSRLNVLLAERDLRQDQIAKDTGISKVTISNLVNNKTNGFQYDTLNELSKYLDINPGELFEYYGQDISLNSKISHINIRDNSEILRTKISNFDLEKKNIDYTVEGILCHISKSNNMHIDVPLAINIRDVDGALADGFEVVGTNLDGVIYVYADIDRSSSTAFQGFLSDLPMPFRQTVIQSFSSFLSENILSLPEINKGAYAVALEELVWFTVVK